MIIHCFLFYTAVVEVNSWRLLVSFCLLYLFTNTFVVCYFFFCFLSSFILLSVACARNKGKLILSASCTNSLFMLPPIYIWSYKLSQWFGFFNWLKSLSPIKFVKAQLSNFLGNKFLVKMYKLYQNYTFKSIPFQR